MKKLIIGSVLSVAAVASTFAQGNVLFSNTTTSKESVNTTQGGAASSTTPATAGTYYYALFFSTTTPTVEGSGAAILPAGPVGAAAPLFAFNDSNWTLGQTALGPAIGANTTAGKFQSLVSGTDGVTTSLNNPTVGSADYFTIVGWSANIGSTIQSVTSWLSGADGALAGAIGESDVSSLITTGIQGVSGPSTIVGAGAGFVNPFVVGDFTPSVPEPGTIALGVMGAASLLALRRKKA
jgi:hypothetical protein